MDLGFLATANSITGTYFDQTAAGRSSVSEVNPDATAQFDKNLENTYSKTQADKIPDENIRQDRVDTNPLSEHAARLGFSIDNRVFDMLGVQISDSMNSMIHSAMENAVDDLVKNV